jgi:hypothetical protein
MSGIGRRTPAPSTPTPEAVVRRRPASAWPPSVDRVPLGGAEQPCPSPVGSLHDSPEATQHRPPLPPRRSTRERQDTPRKLSAHQPSPQPAGTDKSPHSYMPRGSYRRSPTAPRPRADCPDISTDGQASPWSVSDLPPGLLAADDSRPLPRAPTNSRNWAIAAARGLVALSVFGATLERDRLPRRLLLSTRALARNLQAPDARLWRIAGRSALHRGDLLRRHCGTQLAQRGRFPDRSIAPHRGCADGARLTAAARDR